MLASGYVWCRFVKDLSSSSQNNVNAPSGKRASPIKTVLSHRNFPEKYFQGFRKNKFKDNWIFVRLLHQILKTHEKSESPSIHARGYTWTGSSAAKHLLTHCQSSHKYGCCSHSSLSLKEFFHSMYLQFVNLFSSKVLLKLWVIFGTGPCFCVRS